VGERQQIVDTLFAKQQADGGWSLAALGQWKRLDATAIDSERWLRDWAGRLRAGARWRFADGAAPSAST
jgi:hypothetical protein